MSTESTKNSLRTELKSLTSSIPSLVKQGGQFRQEAGKRLARGSRGGNKSAK
jgi:hypothetical protein